MLDAGGKDSDGAAFTVGRAQFHLRRDPKTDALDLMLSALEVERPGDAVRRPYPEAWKSTAASPMARRSRRLLAGQDGWMDAIMAWKHRGGEIVTGPVDIQSSALHHQKRRARTAAGPARAAVSALLILACRARNSARRVSWPISTMARRMARVRVKRSNSVWPSPSRTARCSWLRSSLKRPSTSSTASRLLRNTSRHMVGSEAAMRVKSRKPLAEIFDHFAFGDLFQVMRRAHDIVGDQMRHMAR